MEKEINIRSDEVNEIFAKMPSNMIRWGNTWILIIMISLLFLANYVKYPDILTGSMILNTNHAPVTLVTQQNGKLKLKVSNFQKVKKGQTIALIENDMTIDNLDTIYSILKLNEVETLILSPLPNISIGELQNEWSRFLIELEDYKIYRKIHPEQRGIENSKKQINSNVLSFNNLEVQIEIKREQLSVAEQKLTKDKMLFNRGMIAEREFQNSANTVLELGSTIKSLQSQLIQIQKSNTDYKKQIDDYTVSNIQNESQKLTAVKQSRISILEKIEAWYKRNSFKSPIDGTLQYNTTLADELFVTQGMELFTISPENQTTIEGNLLLPMAGMGKAAVGQKVIVRLQNYPEEEFGVLQGTIKNITPSPNKDKMYLCIVDLPNGLKTSYHKTITYQPKMEGTGDVVTKDKSLLGRIFEQLMKLIQR